MEEERKLNDELDDREAFESDWSRMSIGECLNVAATNEMLTTFSGSSASLEVLAT